MNWELMGAFCAQLVAGWLAGYPEELRGEAHFVLAGTADELLNEAEAQALRGFVERSLGMERNISESSAIQDAADARMGAPS